MSRAGRGGAGMAAAVLAVLLCTAVAGRAQTLSGVARIGFHAYVTEESETLDGGFGFEIGTLAGWTRFEVEAGYQRLLFSDREFQYPVSVWSVYGEPRWAFGGDARGSRGFVGVRVGVGRHAVRRSPRPILAFGLSGGVTGGIAVPMGRRIMLEPQMHAASLRLGDRVVEGTRYLETASLEKIISLRLGIRVRP